MAKNQPDLAREYRKRVNAAMRGMERTVERFAEEVKDNLENTPPMQPVKTGALRESFGHALVTGDDTYEIVTGYEEDVFYAAAIHYKRDVKKWTRPGSGRLFLERAVKLSTPKLDEIMVDEMTKAAASVGYDIKDKK